VTDRPGRPTAAPPPGREWISVADAAERLGVNRRTLTRAAQVGNLEARRIRQLWLTTLPAARAWLKAARHRPGPRPGRGVGRPRPPAGSPGPAGAGPPPASVGPDGPEAHSCREAG
jgi:excisionase family DNA binding protein